MGIFDRHQLRPRNGHTLVVGIVARISGCANQKEISLEDQVDHDKEVIAEMYDGPVEYRIIAMTKAKGERINRPELERVEEECRKRELDILVFEDLGRLVRGEEAVRLIGIAVDNGVRVLIPNDGIDTIDPMWKSKTLNAAAEHVAHNEHTSKRIRHKNMNRFKKLGAAVALVPFGYIKPAGAKTYYDWQKDPTAEAHVLAGAALLRETMNCSAVADLFNRLGVPTGPYCRKKTWSGRMVRRYYRNSLLKGMPGRGFRRSVRHNESGCRKTEGNPDGPSFLEIPHLAYFTVEEFDELNTALAKSNSHCKRHSVEPVIPGVVQMRQDARWPGGHACRCWYCGRPMLWGGNGITEHLMCAGSREWICWNSIGFNGALAARRVVELIHADVSMLPSIDAQIRSLVADAAKTRDGGVTEQLKKLEKDEARLSVEQANLADGIAELGPVPSLKAKAKALEVREAELQVERRKLDALGKRDLVLPKSAEELQALVRAKFEALAMESSEMARLLRRLVPEFDVYLVRTVDGGHLLPRARVKIALDGIVPDAVHVPGLGDLLTKVVTVDLFEPPQRERIRPQAVALAAQGFEQREIARRIDEHPTQTAVYRALALARLMSEMGLSTPYVLVTEPPTDYPKLRRHKNPKYRFEPLDGYQPPAL